MLRPSRRGTVAGSPTARLTLSIADAALITWVQGGGGIPYCSAGASQRGPTRLQHPNTAVGPGEKRAWPYSRSGGGGNRTRVQRCLVKPSPGAVRFASTRPRRSCEQVGVTGPATVSVPTNPVAGIDGDPPDRRQGPGRRNPGLTDFHTRSGGEGEVSALRIGT